MTCVDGASDESHGGNVGLRDIEVGCGFASAEEFVGSVGWGEVEVKLLNQGRKL